MKLASPAELLQGSREGEREPRTKGILALVGLAALGTGYYLAVTTDKPLEALSTFFVAAVLVVIGTYALFLAGSIAVLKALRRRKSFYYKPAHFTVVSGMIYRMKQNAVGLANICILSTMVLVLISTTVSLYAGMDNIMDERFPYDFGVQTYGSGTKEQVDAIVDEELAACGVKEKDEIAYRYGGAAVIRQDESSFTGQATADYQAEDVMEMYFIPLEDYQRSGNDPTALAPDEVIVYVPRGLLRPGHHHSQRERVPGGKGVKEFRLRATRAWLGWWTAGMWSCGRAGHTGHGRGEDALRVSPVL